MKKELYGNIIKQMRSLVEGEADETGVLANASALLMAELKHHWIGFYIIRANEKTGKEELWLGPFQGPVACYRIGYGKGVCGTAWARGGTVIVPDVDAFPGHIACSSLSRSEIVVPLFRNEPPAGDGPTVQSRQVAAVLDIDSAHLNTFDETDRLHLEEICRIISEAIY